MRLFDPVTQSAKVRAVSARQHYVPSSISLASSSAFGTLEINGPLNLPFNSSGFGSGIGSEYGSAVYTRPESSRLPALKRQSSQAPHSGPATSSPYEEEQRLLRRRIRELEGMLKKTSNTLIRERKSHKAYEESEREKAAADELAYRQWQKHWEKELNRVRQEYESQLYDTQSDNASAADGRLNAIRHAFEEEAAERERKQREERVDFLRRQSVRRMMSQDLAGGFAAWTELWEARVYAKSRLLEVANQLRKPELSSAFGFWRDDAHTVRVAARIDAEARRAERYKAESGTLQSDLEKLRFEYERKLASMAAEKEAALHRQFTELTGSAALRAAAIEERAKEERIELLRRQIGRRMLNHDLSNAWSSWYEFWSCKVYATQTLRNAANRLRAPALSSAFSNWTRTHNKQLAALLEEATAARADALAQQECYRVKLENELQHSRAQLDVCVAERDALALKIAQIASSTTSEVQKCAELKDTEVKRQIDFLRRQSVRRMMSQDLAGGFAAWTELWEARVYAKSRLLEVANQLRKPELSSAFGFWRDDAHTVRVAARIDAEARRAERYKAESGTLQSDLEKLRFEYERKLASMAAEKEAALHRQFTELTGSAALRAAAIEERAKEERIELLRRQIGRRMLNHDLSNAWSSWYEFWSCKVYATQTLRKIANRLRAPALSSAFSFWDRDAAVAQAKAASTSAGSIASSVEHERDCLASQLKIMRKQCEQQVADAAADRTQLLARLSKLGDSRVDVETDLTKQLKLEREKRVELVMKRAGRRLSNRSLSCGFSAWLELWEARVNAKGKLRSVANRFRKPELARTFSFWCEHIDAILRAKQTAELKIAHKSSTQLMQTAQDALTAQLAAVRAECAQKLADAANEKREVKLAHSCAHLRRRYRLRLTISLCCALSLVKALARQLRELHGSAEEQMALREQQAKEERVELLTRQIGRRMLFQVLCIDTSDRSMRSLLVTAYVLHVLSQDVSRGFTAWLEYWGCKTHALDQLRVVAGKLRAPELSVAFELWAWLATERKRVRELAALESKGHSLEVQLRQRTFENEQLAMIKVAQDDEIQSLRDKYRTTSYALKEKVI